MTYVQSDLRKSDTTTTPHPHSQLLKLQTGDIIYLNAVEVPLVMPTVVSANYGLGPGDQNREMVAWSAGEDEDPGVLLESQAAGWETGKWDQFKENARFGYKTTYDETQYTTVLNKENITDDQRRHAARIAAEIEGKGGGKRDCESWADDYDEEAKHSCVTRASDTVTMSQFEAATSHYVPPHKRSAGDEQTHHIQSRPPNAQPISTDPNEAHYQRDGHLKVRSDNGAPLPIPPDCYDQGQLHTHEQPPPAVPASEFHPNPHMAVQPHVQAKQASPPAADQASDSTAAFTSTNTDSSPPASAAKPRTLAVLPAAARPTGAKKDWPPSNGKSTPEDRRAV